MKEIATEEVYSEVLGLQKNINDDLFTFFDINKAKGREELSRLLIVKVESIITDLNLNGYKFSSCDYSGDINYGNSEQTFSNEKNMGQRITLHFHGFSAQATWEGHDKYA